MDLSDEQRHSIIQRQRQALMLGEVTYEAGLELKTISGWVGLRSAQTSPGLFGGGTSGTTMVVVVPEIDVAMPDQSYLEVPIRRVISIRYAPAL